MPVPEFSVTLEFASIAFVIPAAGTLRDSVPVVPPPDNPLPLAVVIPVIVPVPVPGNVCPEAKVRMPLLLIFSPVSLGVAVPSP